MIWNEHHHAWIVSDYYRLLLEQFGAAGKRAFVQAAQTYGARVLDIGDATVTIEMTGQTDEMDRFVEHMESFGIREMARTGVTALERGDRTIHDEE